MGKSVKVFIIESELGWGQKIEQTLNFPTRAKANAYARKYNRTHCPPMEVTPEWYMYARVEGQEELGMLR
jgi:hypothetical protein